MEMVLLSLLVAWGITRYGITDLIAAAKGTESPRVAERRQRAAQNHERAMARMGKRAGPTVGEAIGQRIADRIANPGARRGPGPARQALGEWWADGWGYAVERRRRRHERARDGQLGRQRLARAARGWWDKRRANKRAGQDGDEAPRRQWADAEVVDPPVVDGEVVDDPAPDQTGGNRADRTGGDRTDKDADGYDGVVDAELVDPNSTDPNSIGPDNLTVRVVDPNSTDAAGLRPGPAAGTSAAGTSTGQWPGAVPHQRGVPPVTPPVTVALQSSNPVLPAPPAQEGTPRPRTWAVNPAGGEHGAPRAATATHPVDEEAQLTELAGLISVPRHELDGFRGRPHELAEVLDFERRQAAARAWPADIPEWLPAADGLNQSQWLQVCRDQGYHVHQREDGQYEITRVLTAEPLPDWVPPAHGVHPQAWMQACLDQGLTLTPGPDGGYMVSRPEPPVDSEQAEAEQPAGGTSTSGSAVEPAPEGPAVGSPDIAGDLEAPDRAAADPATPDLPGLDQHERRPGQHDQHDQHEDGGLLATVHPIREGIPSMTTTEHTMTSGETLDPNAALAFVTGIESVAQEIQAQIEQSLATLGERGVAGEPIALLQQMQEAAQVLVGNSQNAKGHFERHIATQDTVLADDTLAGTVNGTYMGDRS